MRYSTKSEGLMQKSPLRNFRKTLTVIIPTYCEEKRISVTMRDLERFNAETGMLKKVVVVDDASKDATVEKLLYFRKRLPLVVIRSMENRGKWASIAIGLEQAEGLVLLMDADNSATVWEMKKTGGIPDRGFAVFGSRFGEGAKIQGKSSLRMVLSVVYRMYVKAWYLLAGGKEMVKDFQCPWKLFWKEDLRMPVRTERFAGDVELALRLRSVTIINQPVWFTHVKGSKVNVGTVWDMLRETPVVAIRTKRELKYAERYGF